MLNQIPIYRLLLEPNSYLRVNNKTTAIIDLINQLPNSKNIFHSQRLKGKSIEYIEAYYNSQLLIETKLFCKTLLKDLNIENDSFADIISDNIIQELFVILDTFRLEYLKFLLIADLSKFKLYKDYLEQEINKKDSVENICKVLKKYRDTKNISIYSKLIKCLMDEYKTLKEINE